MSSVFAKKLKNIAGISSSNLMAPVVGFEPTGDFSPTVFKTASIDHSDTQAYGAECEDRTRKPGIIPATD